MSNAIVIEVICSVCGVLIENRIIADRRAVCFSCKQIKKEEWRKKNWGKIIAYQKKRYALRKADK